ncbi:uncharacterized protein LOC110058520 isoform X2 [Orbicella faveolata]|uniref:uncharacterized protein LOC110058520 isoform X2 n=1 Tax=Orbicella faveolata TaxID=48498 RepID=UPI0009E1CFDF|nr:uncharacterized protein LOC110058520 isoform X2 [Orbicella faveolata]
MAEFNQTGEPDDVQADFTEDNPFSQPWEDSDLALVVEGQRFHVHRLILTLNSPVFKAMLTSSFKEATSGEITLPEKNANEVLGFVKQLYVHKREEITMNNVEHLLKLADEYQVKGVLDLCASCLKNEPKTESNAMKILLLAQQYGLSSISEDCCNLLAGIKLDRLEKYEQLPLLNNENLRGILLPRMRHLEEFIRDLSPQVAGIVACTTWLWNEAKKPMAWCPTHFSNGQTKVSLRNCLRTCSACKHVIHCLAFDTVERSRDYYRSSESCTLSRSYTTRDGDHFDSNLSNVLEKLFDLAD